MTQLIRGMYTQTHYSNRGTFGLYNGQMRLTHAVHNGGWYNKAGERLGVGDLDVDDLETITLGLEEDELFIVLPEHASYDRFFKGTFVDAITPGPAHVAAEAIYIIGPCEVMLVDRYGFHEEGETSNLRNYGHGADLPVKFISRKTAKTMITAKAKSHA